MVNLESCGQTVLLDRSILISQKLNENAKTKQYIWDILDDFLNDVFLAFDQNLLFSGTKNELLAECGTPCALEDNGCQKDSFVDNYHRWSWIGKKTRWPTSQKDKEPPGPTKNYLPNLFLQN